MSKERGSFVRGTFGREQLTKFMRRPILEAPLPALGHHQVSEMAHSIADPIVRDANLNSKEDFEEALRRLVSIGMNLTGCESPDRIEEKVSELRSLEMVLLARSEWLRL